MVSPTNDFQNVAPRLINQTKGVLLTGFIGIALMSWELLKRMGWLDSDVSVDSLYSNWLIGYSSLLGPIAGIMVVDYFVYAGSSTTCRGFTWTAARTRRGTSQGSSRFSCRWR